MAMNQPSPEILAQLMAQGQNSPEGAKNPEEAALLAQEMEEEAANSGMPQEGQMPPEMGGMPPQGMMPPVQEPQVDIDPAMILPEVVVQYMNYALTIMHDKELDKKIQSDILVQQAQALSSLVPLLQNDAEMEMAKMEMEMQFKQQEMELKREEMSMNLEMKQAEMEMKANEHQQKLQFNEQSNQQKLRQQEENHQHSIVQGQQSHESKMEQQKQAAQLKQSQKPTSKQGK